MSDTTFKATVFCLAIAMMIALSFFISAGAQRERAALLPVEEEIARHLKMSVKDFQLASDAEVRMRAKWILLRESMKNLTPLELQKLGRETQDDIYQGKYTKSDLKHMREVGILSLLNL